MSSSTFPTLRFRLLPAFLLLLGTAACGRDDNLVIGANTFLVDEQITSEKYGKWVQAQQNLDRDATDADMVTAQDRLGIRRATRGAVDSAVTRLEQNERTRQAIESAGLSVREYVITSLGLAQAFAASNPARRTAFQGVPAQNVELVNTNRADFERFRTSSRFRVVDDRDTDTDGRDTDGKRERDTDKDKDTDKNKGNRERKSERDT